MNVLLLFMLTVHTAAFYITAIVEKPMVTSTLPTTLAESTSMSTSTSSSSTTTTTTQHPLGSVVVIPSSSSSSSSSPLSTITFSPLVTIAPLSRNPLELRQRCYNDQGFSVDCATWTGYYYTWGGSGHPYSGGPGSSGNDGQNGNNAITGIVGSANRLEGVKMPSLLTLVALCLLVVVL